MAIFLASRAASTTGDQLLQFAVPLIVFRSTGSVSMSGLAFLCEWLPRLISLPLAGLLSDRIGGGPVYITADAVRAAACMLAALALAHCPSHSFTITALLMALCAFCYAQAFIALETTLPQLVPPQQIAKAQSVLQMINYGSGLLGPALAGVLLLWVHPAQLLLIAAAVFALSATGAIGLGGSLRHRTGHKVNIIGDLRTGIHSILKRPVLLRLTALAMAVNLIVGLAMVTGAAMTVGHFGQKDQFYASLQLIIGTLSIASFLIVPWLLRRLSVYQIGKGAFLLIVTGTIMMGMAHVFPLYVLGYGLTLGLCGLFNVFARTERLHWIDVGERGRVIGLIVFLNQLSLPLAGLLVAVFGERVPTQHLFLFVAVVATVSYLLLFRPLETQAHTAQPVEQG
jgi:MFS family permease